MVVVNDRAHDIVGVSGGEDPQDFTAGSERLEGRPNRNHEGEPKHGETEPATDVVILEDAEADQKHSQESSPANDSSLRVEGVRGEAKVQLEKPPEIGRAS